MNSLAILLLTVVDLVADGSAALRIETDGRASSRSAADLLQRHVVLLTGVALPSQGVAHPLRIQSDAEPGYRIEPIEGGGVLLRGADPTRAVYDLLEGWGVALDDSGAPPPRTKRLEIPFLRWKPTRRLEIAAAEFDPTLPAQGFVTKGLADYDPRRVSNVIAAGYRVIVVSDSFDDFLPPAAHFETHVDWFALRSGERVPRGNFALTNRAARDAYLAALAAWLSDHPEVDTLGIWPEVTSVWCEDSLALGPGESYALLWRAAARAHPDREFEVLATGPTLAPPAGNVPANVRVRFRPGRAASALQPVADQSKIEAAVRAWEARGARLVLDIDGAPESWCGLPWPCHGAVRGDALRFQTAVLKNPSRVLARIWRDPETHLELGEEWDGLLTRAAALASWGDPKDTAALFVDPRFGNAYFVGEIERLLQMAWREGPAAAEAAREAFLGYRTILEVLEPGPARIYRRYREREFRRLAREKLPSGVTYALGPAEVTDSFDRVRIKTDRLIVGIDRSTAIVDTLQLRHGIEWSGNLAGEQGRLFRVVALDTKGEPVLGEVRLRAPEQGVLEILLSGAIGTSAVRWHSTLRIESASGVVRQNGRVTSEGGLAIGSRCSGAVFDHWVCPAYAREGRLGSGGRPAFGMPPRTLLYCRKGDRGPGMALRVPRGGTVRLVDEAETTLLATSPYKEMRVEWIFFSDSGELGR